MCERDKKSDEIWNKRHEALVYKIDKLDQKYDALYAENAKLATRCEDMGSEIESLKLNMNEINQSLLSRNLVIRGVPEIEKNSVQLNVLVKAVLFAMDVSPEHQRVSTAFRLGKKDDKKNTDRPILVRLVNEECREAIINAKRKKKDLNCSMVIIHGVPLGASDDDIYVQEQLTRHKSELLAEARKLKTDGLIQYAWTNNGDILVREKAEGPVKKILHVNQLNKIRNTTTNVAASGSGSSSQENNQSEDVSTVSNGGSGVIGGNEVNNKPGKNPKKATADGARKRKQTQEEGRNTRQRTAAAAALSSILE